MVYGTIFKFHLTLMHHWCKDLVLQSVRPHRVSKRFSKLHTKNFKLCVSMITDTPSPKKNASRSLQQVIANDHPKVALWNHLLLLDSNAWPRNSTSIRETLLSMKHHGTSVTSRLSCVMSCWNFYPMISYMKNSYSIFLSLCHWCRDLGGLAQLRLHRVPSRLLRG